ncbi:MAG: SH3 domain-containing protein [Leptolyngbyaceae cyanobacterium]
MTQTLAMGTAAFRRALTITGILLLWACQPATEPEQAESPPSLSTAIDQSSEALANNPQKNTSHQKGMDQDVSALKRSPNQSSIEVSEQACSATAYTGNVAAGITIRQEPSRDAPTIGTLSTQEPSLVTVAGAQSDWLYITQDPDNPGDSFEPGWIQGNLLATQVRSTDTSRPDGTAPLQVAPGLAAAPLAEVVTGTEVAVIGCTGDWLKVQVPDTEAGWLAPEHQCSNPFSTCP